MYWVMRPHTRGVAPGPHQGCALDPLTIFIALLDAELQCAFPLKMSAM